MKALRRSVNDKGSSRDLHPSTSSPSPTGSSQHHAPALSKPSSSIQPPKKVIRAKEAHVSQSPNELPFSKGDFFYVVGERDVYYEALNTISNARGLVPKSKFEEFGRGGVHKSSKSVSDVSSHGRNGSLSQPTPSSSLSKSAGAKSASQLYGVVLYDFKAERPDELEAKADEPIIIMAQSNHEWFVAKPIGRLGGPGLIPVTFVQIQDPATGAVVTNVEELLRQGQVPKVEDWKAKNDEYKAASIPLGRFDLPPNGQNVPDSPYTTNNGGPLQAQQQQAMMNSRPQEGTAGPYPGHHPRALDSSAHQSRPSHGGEGRQPQHQKQSSHSSNSRFQHKQQSSVSDSIDDIPVLAPGTFTSAAVLSFHKEENQYLFRIHATYLPENPADPALRLILFRLYEDFYHFQIALLDAFPEEAGRTPEGSNAPARKRIMPYMPGPLDVVDDDITNGRRAELNEYVLELIALHRIGAGYVLSDGLVRKFFSPATGDHHSQVKRSIAEQELQTEKAQPPLVDLNDQFGGLTIEEEGPNTPQHDSSYAQQQQHTRRSSSQQHQQQYSPSSQGRVPPGHSKGLSNGNNALRGVSPLPPPIDTSQPSYKHARSGSSSLPSAVPTSSSWGSVGGQGLSSFSPMSAVPPQQAGNRGSEAYKKIKVYDHVTDDVLAIRVPNSVTYEQLVAKIHDRLGGGHRTLSYRDSMQPGKVMRPIMDNRDLDQWMSSTEKLVIYAD